MAMNRSQLRNMIDSGRAIALDCYGIGREIPSDDPVGCLFKTEILNKSVLMKRYEAKNGADQQEITVNTLIYFPYDYDNPYDGGEVLNYNDPAFNNAFEFKLAQGYATREQRQLIDQDFDILKMVDSLHSLDPFLFKCRAEQTGRTARIHDSYFRISTEDWERIRKPIRGKISKLVSMALGMAESSQQMELRQQYVERFLHKIWEAKDVNGIEPFVKAMQISPDKAPEVFFAWKAVCYYQVRYAELQSELNNLFRWVGSSRLCYPVDFKVLSEEELSRIKARRNVLRQKMRRGYVKSHDVINDYERSYRRFVEDGRPQAFVGFLLNSENIYMNLAAHVSVATHAINVWKFYMKQFGDVLRSQEFTELFDGLTMLYGVDNDELRRTEVSFYDQNTPIANSSRNEKINWVSV